MTDRAINQPPSQRPSWATSGQVPTWVRGLDKLSGASGYWYDATRRFDGGGFVLPETDNAQDEADCFPYVGTPPLLGAACLDLLDPHPDTTFIDVGAGKGRMVAMAATRGFGRALGVELDTNLVAAAADNFASNRFDSLAHRPVVLHSDARQFDWPDQPLALYFNNPFGSSILAEVLVGLESSLRDTPRRATLLLQRRVIEDPANDSDTPGVLASASWLTGGPIRPRRRWQRFVLQGWAMWRFESTIR